MPDLGHFRLHVERWGSGPPIVLLHGGASSSAQWRRLRPLLEDRYQLIAPDLVGCGQTPAWPKKEIVGHDTQADLVAAELGGGHAAPVTLVGHSFGGAIAVRLVLRYPHLVRSLVLIEPILMVLLRDAGDPLFPEYEALATGFIADAAAGRPEAAWAAYLDYRQGAGTWAALSADAKARVVENTASGAEALITNLAHPTRLDDCRRIVVPTTIMCGERTASPDRRVTEVLRDAVPGSHYVTITGAGHMSPLTHPADVAEAITHHLARCGPD